MTFIRTTAILSTLIIALFIKPTAYSQVLQAEVDSLIILFKDAGRNWDEYADQFIEIGEPAVPALVRLLQDSSQTQWVRRIAAMTLNDIHSSNYVEPAFQLLMDRGEDPVIRNQVTNGLKGHDLSHVSEKLWEIFKEEQDEFFRLNIADILKSSDPFLAYQAYETLYFDSEGFCKKQALINLVRLTPHEATDWYLLAIQVNDWMTGNLVMDSLVAMDNLNPGKFLRLYYKASTPELVRWRVIRVMGLRPESNYLDLFLDALADPDWLVQNEAALVLSRMPAGKVLPDMRILEQTGEPELVDRAGWVIHQLEEVDDEERASMQPFSGYPMLVDMEDIMEVLKNKCMDTITFRQGEVVADVGAGNGYLEAMLSMFNDDLTFYIQDIDASVCNQENFAEVVDFYMEVNGEPFTNKFNIVIGTDTKSNLPEHTFDKILMLWTYQYLKYPIEFVTDLREKLKNGGLFYVINPELDYEHAETLTMEYGWNASTVERQVSDIISCGFELVRMARNYDSSDLPYIMVFKKK